jgi:hypothetical protein
LGEAIKAYRAQHDEELDEHARTLLSRLARSPKAAEVFGQLKPKDGDGEAPIVKARQLAHTRAFLEQVEMGNPDVVQAIEQQLKPKEHGQAVDAEAAIIRACVMAEHLARIFPERVKKALKMLERGEQHRRAVAALRVWLDEIFSEQSKLPDPLWVRGLETRDDMEAMGLGLALFERRIEVEKHVAEVNLYQLRATQKHHLRATRKNQARRKPVRKMEAPARQVAAVKLLADEVKRVTGKPHYAEIADLASVILRTEVSLDQVRAAQRLRGGHREWAVRSLPEEMRKRPKAARLRAK